MIRNTRCYKYTQLNITSFQLRALHNFFTYIYINFYFFIFIFGGLCTISMAENYSAALHKGLKRPKSQHVAKGIHRAAGFRIFTSYYLRNKNPV